MPSHKLLFSITAIVLCFSFSRSEEHTSELQSPCNLVCRLLLEIINLIPIEEPARNAHVNPDVRAEPLRVALGRRRKADLHAQLGILCFFLNRGPPRDPPLFPGPPFLL